MVCTPSPSLRASILLFASLSWAGCVRDEPTAPDLGPRPPVTHSITAAAAELQISVEDLGTLGGYSRAFDVNDSEWIVGGSVDPVFGTVPFLKRGAAPMERVVVEGFIAQAEAVSNSEVVPAGGDYVAGWTFISGTGIRAFRWQNGAVTVPASGGTSRAFAVDEGGMLGGQLRPSGVDRAATWSGIWTLQGTLGGDAGSINDITKAGAAVGRSATSIGGPSEAAFWPDASDPRIPPLGLGTLGGSDSDARAINAAGDAVGMSLDATNRRRPVRWRDGGLDDLLGSADGEGEAFDISDAGYVVGEVIERVVEPDGFVHDVRHAVLWTPSGEMIDLEELVVSQLDPAAEQTFARGINNHEVIVGHRTTDGVERATLWRVEAAAPPTPAELLEELTTDIEALVASGALPEDEGNGLLAKVQNAQKQLEKGKPKTAINVLQALINQLEELVVMGVLSQVEAQLLIDKAEAAIEGLQLTAQSPPGGCASHSGRPEIGCKDLKPLPNPLRSSVGPTNRALDSLRPAG